MGKEKELSCLSMDRIVAQKLREWADCNNCYCGKDMRRFAKEHVVIYVFHNRSSYKGLSIEVNYNEVKDLDESINYVLNHVNRVFAGAYGCGFAYNTVKWAAAKNEIAEYKWKQKYNIERVIFNNPATIVFWEDGTKTVVKRQKGDRWDREKGIAMAIAKKLYGNTGKYYDILKEHLED